MSRGVCECVRGVRGRLMLGQHTRCACCAGFQMQRTQARISVDYSRPDPAGPCGPTCGVRTTLCTGNLRLGVSVAAYHEPQDVQHHVPDRIRRRSTFEADTSVAQKEGGSKLALVSRGASRSDAQSASGAPLTHQPPHTVARHSTTARAQPPTRGECHRKKIELESGRRS